IARMAMVIGDVEPVSVVERNAVLPVALVVVPADEADRVAEIGAARRPAARLALVACPGAVERLRKAERARLPLPGNEAEELGARRACVVPEAGLRIDRG